MLDRMLRRQNRLSTSQLGIEIGRKIGNQTRGSAIAAGFALCLLASLGACANTPAGKTLEQSLAADPRLKENPTVFGSPTPTPVAISQEKIQSPQLPPSFPSEIPLYPNADLQEVTPIATPGTGDRLRWRSTDPSNLIENFYQTEFGKKNWQLVSRPSEDGQGPLVAKRDNLQVTVSLLPNQTAGVTEFIIEYGQGNQEITASPLPSPSTTPATPSPAPIATATPSVTPKPEKVSQDQNQAPVELRPYVADLTQLGVLKLRSPSDNAASEATDTLPDPNKSITRRQYARWLAAANNQIYANRPAKQIRLAVASSEPAFSDLPKTDPDFPAIQGLAEAGIIPSSLSGESKEVKFRPEDPLTREQMLLWKVPLDTRQVLPAANLDAVKERWGFQDSSKIDPQASRALLADFNNGDLANTRRAFGFTTLFQPKKPVTRAEAAASLWYFGVQAEGLSAKEALQAKSQTKQ